jgi:hypothetical protein
VKQWWGLLQTLETILIVVKLSLQACCVSICFQGESFVLTTCVSCCKLKLSGTEHMLADVPKIDLAELGKDTHAEMALQNFAGAESLQDGSDRPQIIDDCMPLA